MSILEREIRRYALSQISCRRFIYNTVAIVSDPASQWHCACNLSRRARRKTTPARRSCTPVPCSPLTVCVRVHTDTPCRVTTNIGRENFNVSTAFNPSKPAAVGLH